MLNLTTALGRNGWQDWLIQRASALIIGIYSIFLLLYWLIVGSSHLAWQYLFSIQMVRLATTTVIVMTALHAWIGLWTICGDYIKLASIRMLALIIIYLFLLFDFIWSIQILWGY